MRPIFSGRRYFCLFNAWTKPVSGSRFRRDFASTMLQKCSNILKERRGPTVLLYTTVGAIDVIHFQLAPIYPEEPFQKIESPQTIIVLAPLRVLTAHGDTAVLTGPPVETENTVFCTQLWVPSMGPIFSGRRYTCLFNAYRKPFSAGVCLQHAPKSVKNDPPAAGAGISVGLTRLPTSFLPGLASKMLQRVPNNSIQPDAVGAVGDPAGAGNCVGLTRLPTSFLPSFACKMLQTVFLQPVALAGPPVETKNTILTQLWLPSMGPIFSGRPYMAQSRANCP
eukprot:gene15271-biopygen5183